MTDTDGRLLAVQVHAADIQNRVGAKGALTLSRRAFPFVERVFADGGDAGRLVARAQDKAQVAPEIVRRPPWAEGGVVIRRRRVVERSFAWIMTCRRPVRDDEQLARIAEALITVAAHRTPRQVEVSGLLKRARGPDSLDHALIIAACEAPARTMAAGEDEDFPAAAGMTFLGPLIGHDATLDVASALAARIDPTESRNVRAPTLDLGRACGDRPEAPLHPYGALDARRGAERMPVLGAAASPPLLARTSGGHALIGDPRNDGNQIVSHAQGRIIRLHAILMPKATQDETHVGDRAKTGEIRRSGSITRQAG